MQIAAAPGSAALPGAHRTTSSAALDSGGLFCLVVGIAITLIISGYQFGGGNHTVYLLDGLRVLHPELLAHDWFTTRTLQYHAVFSEFTAACMRLHVLELVFLLGYLAMVLLWHVAWRGMVHAVGADDRTYLLSVVFYYISAAGISIGVFQFLQDACFLPSNVANVAMLWAFYCWMRDRKLACGIWMGVSGLFHINFAALVIGMWTVLALWEWWADDRQLLRRWPFWIGTVVAFAPSLFNLGNAVPDELRHGGTMPMGEFVSVYVRFRHAHHFDPIHWPIGLWASFLWPIPLAAIAAVRHRGDGLKALQEANRIFLIILALLVFAFIFAGIWFLNEPVVQLCLWRFSIYVKMMSCIGAAWLLIDRLARGTVASIYVVITIVAAAALAVFATEHERLAGLVAREAWTHREALVLFVIVLSIIAIDRLLGGKQEPRQAFRWLVIFAVPVVLALAWPRLGVGMTPEPTDPNYRDVCRWAAKSTPIDSIFLTPPQETDFRLYGERAIVVNFKHVPQLSGEIIQWRQRLLDVLGLHDLKQLPHDYTRTMAALGEIYDQRSAGGLIAVARQYGARFIVIDHALDDAQLTPVFHAPPNPFFVYEIRPSIQPSAQTPVHPADQVPAQHT